VVFEESPPHPNTVVALARNDELLKKVLDEYTQKFGTKPVEFEKFVKQFEAKTEVLQDTAVKKEVSPVVGLTVKFKGREETRFLMESWIRNLVRNFGNFALTEAKLKYEAIRKQEEALDKDLREGETEQARLLAELPLQQKFLAEKMDLLAPAEMRRPTITSLPQLEDSNNMQIVMEQTPAKPPGLLARLSEARLALERAKKGVVKPETSTVAELEIDVQTLDDAITQTQASIGDLQKNVAELQQKLSTVTRDIQVKSQTQRHLHKFLDGVKTVSATYHDWDGTGLPTAGDLRALSEPVLPELRTWPKRTMVAAVAAAAVFFLSLVYLLFARYMREVAEKVSPTG
jgi:chromosome segregation ATPase